MPNNDLTPHAAEPTEDNKVKEALDQGAETIDAVKAKVLEMKDEAVARGTDFLDGLTGVIQANPLPAIAIAAGLGALWLLGGRR